MMNTTKWLAATFVTAALAAPQPVAQRTFTTPADAAATLVQAVRDKNVNLLVEVVGPESRDWLFSGDKVADGADWGRFVAAYDKKHEIVMQGDAKAMLNVGADVWPFPAPLVSKSGQWHFDAEAGREEILNRRVGRNELDTIQTLLAIVDAQREYAITDADHSGLTDYASRFKSLPGKKDGLYWPTKEGEPPSPLGLLVANAVREGYEGIEKPGQSTPYHGYYYRMLTAQGKAARGGAYNYLVNGKLFGGFAAVAYPATYGVSGVETYIVNHVGVVYQKDLGSASGAAAQKMKLFDPGEGWKEVR